MSFKLTAGKTVQVFMHKNKTGISIKVLIKSGSSELCVWQSDPCFTPIRLRSQDTRFVPDNLLLGNSMDLSLLLTICLCPILYTE